MKADIKDIILYSSRIFMAVQEIIPVVSEVSKAVSIVGNLRSAIDRCKRHYHKKTSDLISDEAIDRKLENAREQAIEVLLEKAIEKSLHDQWKTVRDVDPEMISGYIRAHLNRSCRFDRNGNIEIIHVVGETKDEGGDAIERLCMEINKNFSDMFKTINEENAALVIEIEDLKRVDESIADSIEHLSRRLGNLYSPLSTSLPMLPDKCIARHHVVARLGDIIERERLCFFSGEGGSGKTTLARLVCDALSDRYAIAWISIDNNSVLEEKKSWYHSMVGREFCVMFGRLAYPTFSQFGKGSVTDYEVRQAFSTFMRKGPTLLVVDMNTIDFTHADYDFLLTPAEEKGVEYSGFPSDWRFLILTRKVPEYKGEGKIIDFNSSDSSGKLRLSARMSKDEIVEQLASEIRYLNTDYSYTDYMLSDLADYAKGNPLLASHLANEVNYYSEKTVKPIMTLQRRLVESSGWTGDDVFSRLMNILDFESGQSRWGDDIYDYLKLCIILPTEPLAHPHLVFGESAHSKERFEILKRAGILRETKTGVICHDQVKNAISSYFFDTFVVSQKAENKRLGEDNPALMEFLLSLSEHGRYEERSLVERLSCEIMSLKGVNPEIRRHKIEPLVISIFSLSGLIGNDRYYELFGQGGRIGRYYDKDRMVPLLSLFECAMYVLKGGLLTSSVLRNVSAYILICLKTFEILSENPLLYERCCFILSRNQNDSKDLGASLKFEALSLALERMKKDSQASLDAVTYATSYLFSRANAGITGYDDFMLKFYAYLAIAEKDGIDVMAEGESRNIHAMYREIEEHMEEIADTDVIVQKSRILDNFAGGLGAYGFYDLQCELKEKNYQMLKAGLSNEVLMASEILEKRFIGYDEDSDLSLCGRIFSLLDYESRDALAFRLNNLGYSIMDLSYWAGTGDLLKAEGYLLSSRFIYKGMENENASINLKALMTYYLRMALMEKDAMRRAEFLDSAEAYLNAFSKAYSAFKGVPRKWFTDDIEKKDDIAIETRSLFIEKEYLAGKITKEEAFAQTLKWSGYVKKGAALFRHLRFLEIAGISSDRRIILSDVLKSYYEVHVAIPFEKDFNAECRLHENTRGWNLDCFFYRDGLKRLYSKYVEGK